MLEPLEYLFHFVLFETGLLLDDFPQQEDRVTVIQLDDDQKIVSINFWEPDSGQNPLSK